VRLNDLVECRRIIAFASLVRALQHRLILCRRFLIPARRIVGARQSFYRKRRILILDGVARRVHGFRWLSVRHRRLSLQKK